MILIPAVRVIALDYRLHVVTHYLVFKSKNFLGDYQEFNDL